MKFKKHILRFRKINLKTFEQIKKGIKKIETRAAGPKYEHIKSGEILVFSCGGKKFEKKIKNLTKFRSLKGLFKKYPIEYIMPDCKNFKEAVEVYYKYPGYKERIRKYGILAFELTTPIHGYNRTIRIY